MTHKQLDRLGHVAYTFILIGVLLIGQKIIWGWMAYVAGNLLWAWLGRQLRLHSVVLWSTVFIGTSIYGLWSWLS